MTSERARTSLRRAGSRTTSPSRSPSDVVHPVAAGRSGTTRPEVDDRVIAHIAFARAVAARAIDPRCRGEDREDLIAWGVLGLVQAARRYEDSAGATFGSYAARRVRGQVLDALRERDPLTRSARRAFRAARELDPDLPPPAVEVSLERAIARGAEPAAVEVCRARQDARWSGVAKAVRALPPLERRVLVLAYGRGLTLREIGEKVALSESGVCRVRSRALARLRQRCADERRRSVC